MKGKLLFLAILFLIPIPYTLFPIYTHAQDATQVGFSQISPASPLYFLKAVRENFEWRLAKKKGEQVSRQLEFAQRRLREINSLLGGKDESFIAPTANRYQAQMDKASSISGDSDDLQLVLTDYLSRHLLVLEDQYSRTSDRLGQVFLRATIEKDQELSQKLIDKAGGDYKDRLTITLSQSQYLTCQFFIKEASLSALNEVEREDLSQRAQNCPISAKIP